MTMTMICYSCICAGFKCFVT